MCVYIHGQSTDNNQTFAEFRYLCLWTYRDDSVILIFAINWYLVSWLLETDLAKKDEKSLSTINGNQENQRDSDGGYVNWKKMHFLSKA